MTGRSQRHLAIIAATPSTFITADEQREGHAFVQGVYNLPCPYKSKASKHAWRHGKMIANRFDHLPYVDRLAQFRKVEGLPERCDYRHTELGE